MEPQQYSNLGKLFSPRTATGVDNMTYTALDAGASHSDATVYDEIGFERSITSFKQTEDETKKKEKGKKEKGRKETKPLPTMNTTDQQLETSKESLAEKLKEALKARKQPPNPEPEADKNVSEHAHKTPPPLMTKPKRPPPDIPKTADDFSVPVRTPVAHGPIPQREVDPKNEYANDVPRSRILPTYRDDHVLLPETPKESSTDSAESCADTKQIPDVNTGDDVRALTIDEVCQFLGVLKLESYADIFRENMVDGVLLTSLGREDFLSEFAMKPLEAMRLWNFAQSGHVPK